MSAVNGTVLARLGPRELLLAIGARNRLVVSAIEPRPRVGQRVVVADGVAVALLTPDAAAVADAIGPRGTVLPPCRSTSHP